MEEVFLLIGIREDLCGRLVSLLFCERCEWREKIERP